MSTAGLAEDIAFGLSAFIAVAGALGMTTTMSMFRSGIFLMASFMGVAGLFILLSADLLGLLQIMMYIGGMLVMILFMVLFMPDPGGAMMADMPGMMTPVEQFFSRGLAQKNPEGGDPGPSGAGAAAEASGGHAEHHDHEHDDGHASEHADGNDGHEGMEGMGDMDMSDMSMVTPVRGLAVWIAVATGGVLTALLLLRPDWPLSGAAPDPRSAERVGTLLMGKYMVGFEGAGFLILIGVFGAVFAARPDRHPDPRGRAARTAVAEAPSSLEPDQLDPLAEPFRDDHDDRGSEAAAGSGSHGHHAAHGGAP